MKHFKVLALVLITTSVLKVHGEVHHASPVTDAPDNLVQVDLDARGEIPHGREVRRYKKRGGSCNPKGVVGHVMGALSTLVAPFRDCFIDRQVIINSAQGGVQKAYDVAQDFIEGDKDACECFQQTFVGKKIMSEDGKSIEEQEDDMTFRILQANIKRKGAQLQTMSDGMLIQAHFLAGAEKDPKKRLDFLKLYNEKVDDETLHHVDRFKDSLKVQGVDELRLKTNQSRFKKIVDTIEAPKSLDKNTLPSDEIPAKPKGACFSVNAYIAWEQRPKSASFLQELAREEWRPENWDVDVLKKRYDEAYLKYEGEIDDADKRAELERPVELLKSRILFLKKNPLYANLMSSKGSGLTDEERVKLQGRKAQLFGLLQKKFTGNKNCRPKDAKCFNRRAKQELKIDRDLRELFTDPIVWKASREELNERITNEYVNGSTTVMSQKLPTTQPGLHSKYRDMTGNSVVMCSKLLERMNGEARDKARDACVQKFPMYCKMVEKVHQGLQNKELFVKPSDDLEAEVNIDFNPNPATHNEFNNLTELFCNAQRVNKKNPKDKSTFEQFKAKTCDKNILEKALDLFRKDICENPQALLASYLEQYALPPGTLLREGWAEYEANFVSFMGNLPRAKNLTVEELDEINEGSVSGNFIRKHSTKEAYSAAFKGFMSEQVQPNVASAQSGSLVPPAAFSPKADDPLSPSLIPTGTTGEARPTPKKEAAKSDEVDGKGAQELRKEKEDELAQSKSELAGMKDKKAIEAMSKKIADLERLLSKKDDEFMRFLRESKEEKDKEKAHHVSKAQAPGSEDGEEKHKHKTSAAAGAFSGDEGHGPSRGIASVADSGGFGAGAIGGHKAQGAAAAAERKVSMNKLNKALLEKYGIVVPGSTEAQLLLAQEKDPESLQKLISAHGGTLVPLEVPASVFEKLQQKDLGTLKDIYEKKVSELTGAVVKISVSTKGKNETLEFYAIREGGQVVFQPVRKHEASMLRKLVTPQSGQTL